jgi:hypothetical protein
MQVAWECPSHAMRREHCLSTRLDAPYRAFVQPETHYPPRALSLLGASKDSTGLGV